MKQRTILLVAALVALAAAAVLLVLSFSRDDPMFLQLAILWGAIGLIVLVVVLLDRRRTR